MQKERIMSKIICGLCFLVAQPLLAKDSGFWTSLTVKSYSSEQEKRLERYSDGKTSYGTNVYQEGAAADKRYYPKGTKFYVACKQNGEKKGRWFKVDDTLPETVGKNGTIYLRFLTISKADSWRSGTYKVYVVIPRRHKLR